MHYICNIDEVRLDVSARWCFIYSDNIFTTQNTNTENAETNETETREI